MEGSRVTYFQYQKDLDLPVYICIDLNQFTPEVIGLLTQMRFQELSKRESEEAMVKIESDERGRVLLIEEASSAVAKRIDMTSEHNRYGAESLVQGSRHRIYRYKGVALMAYSYQMAQWQLGCFGDFGNKNNTFAPSGDYQPIFELRPRPCGDCRAVGRARGRWHRRPQAGGGVWAGGFCGSPPTQGHLCGRGQGYGFSL